MVTKRYKTVRTRVGRFLSVARPSGSGAADFPVPSEYKGFTWLFGFIKNRKTVTNLAIKRNPTQAIDSDVESAQSESFEVMEEPQQQQLPQPAASASAVDDSTEGMFCIVK